MLVLRREFEIPWGDCDAAGIVYYPRYLEWFDHSTHGLFSLGGLRDMRERFEVIGVPMVDLQVTFKAPSRYGDVVLIETSIAAFRRSSFEVAHRLLRADGTLAVDCMEIRVWAGVDAEGRIKARAIPEEVIASLSAPS